MRFCILQRLTLFLHLTVLVAWVRALQVQGYSRLLTRIFSDRSRLLGRTYDWHIVLQGNQWKQEQGYGCHGQAVSYRRTK
jgi:hypothetical protein